MINKVTLIGNLGQDAELKTFEDGNSRVTFSLATNENYKDKAGEWQSLTEWHNVVIRGKSAERASDLKKGARIYTEGKLRTRKWTDNSGNEKYRTEVICSMFRGLDKKDNQDFDELPYKKSQL